MRITWPGIGLIEKWTLILVIVATITIIVIHPYPPSNDASSHIATAVIAKELLARDEFFAQYYGFSTVPLPYWMPTVIMQPLLALFDPLLSYRILMVIYTLLLVLAIHALYRAAGIEENRYAIVALASLGIFNWAYWFGETGFLLGQPLAIYGYAVFLRIERLKSREFIIFVLISLGVYFCHVFALASLLVASGGLFFVRFISNSQFKLKSAQWLSLCWLLCLLCIAVYFIMIQHGTIANRGELIFDLSPKRIFQVLTKPLASPSPEKVVGLIFALTIGSICFLPYVFTHGMRALRQAWRPILFPSAISLVALVWLGPVGLQDSTGFVEVISQRFSLFAFILCLGTFKFSSERLVRFAFVCVVVCFALWKLYSAALLHHNYQDKAKRITANLLSEIPEHSRVLPLQDMDNISRWSELFHRFGNYVVTFRHSYGPHVFARTGQQPLYHRLIGEHRGVRNLNVSDADWIFYDYILLQTNRVLSAVPFLYEKTDLVAMTDEFYLYKVRQSAKLIK